MLTDIPLLILCKQYSITTKHLAFASIGVTSHLEVACHLWEAIHRLSANTVPFYFKTQISVDFGGGGWGHRTYPPWVPRGDTWMLSVWDDRLNPFSLFVGIHINIHLLESSFLILIYQNFKYTFSLNQNFFIYLFVNLNFFETGLPYIAQSGLELNILLASAS